MSLYSELSSHVHLFAENFLQAKCVHGMVLQIYMQVQYYTSYR